MLQVFVYFCSLFNNSSALKHPLSKRLNTSIRHTLTDKVRRESPAVVIVPLPANVHVRVVDKLDAIFRPVHVIRLIFGPSRERHQPSGRSPHECALLGQVTSAEPEAGRVGELVRGFYELYQRLMLFDGLDRRQGHVLRVAEF